MWLGGIRPLGLAALCGALSPAWSLAAAGGVTASAGIPAGGSPTTVEQQLLDRFRAGFAPQVPTPPVASADGDDPAAGRCGTPLVIEYLAHRNDFSPSTTQVIDAWLVFTETGDTLLSPNGHFRLTWVLDGDNAVPLVDTDPKDGIPDFVSCVARYLEEAWAVQFAEVGLRLPPPAGPVEVSFRRMHFYGYTVPVDPQAGTARIVMHNTFARFPPNDDSEGNVAGSTKVTAAHELRHVSQYAGSRWSESGWVELDATWAEERVFSQVNDYHHYLLGDSPVRRPQVPLDSGYSGTGTYDDAVFEIWLNERWGDAAIREYWDRRALSPDQDPLATWNAVLESRGTSLALAWAEFIGWNFAVGSRALAGVGYPDAADYPTGDAAAALTSYPAAASGFVEHLAAAPVNLSGFAGLGDRLLALDFDGDDQRGPLALGLYVQTVDGGGYLETIGLDADNDAHCVLRMPASELREVAVLVGNPARSGAARPWTVAVDTVPGPPGPLVGRLLGVHPNPSNPASWLSCEMTARAEATLEIVDPAGRRVRRLFSGSLGPGQHRFFWDGRNEQGHPTPAGVYVARLGTARGWQGRKLTIVR